MLWIVIKITTYVLIFLFLLSFGTFLAGTESIKIERQDRGNNVNDRRTQNIRRHSSQ